MGEAASIVVLVVVEGAIAAHAMVMGAHYRRHGGANRFVQVGYRAVPWIAAACAAGGVVEALWAYSLR